MHPFPLQSWNEPTMPIIVIQSEGISQYWFSDKKNGVWNPVTTEILPLFLILPSTLVVCVWIFFFLICFKFQLFCQLSLFNIIYLFIWPCCVAWGLNQAPPPPGPGSMESSSLDHQGSPCMKVLNWASSYHKLVCKDFRAITKSVTRPLCWVQSALIYQNLSNKTG